MNIKEKMKSYSFWMSLTSAVILVINLIGQKYGFVIDDGFISDLVTSLCGVFVILGIIVLPTNKNTSETKTITNQESNFNSSEDLVDTTIYENVETPANLSSSENDIRDEHIDITDKQSFIQDNCNNDNIKEIVSSSEIEILSPEEQIMQILNNPEKLEKLNNLLNEIISKNTNE